MELSSVGFFLTVAALTNYSLLFKSFVSWAALKGAVKRGYVLQVLRSTCTMLRGWLLDDDQSSEEHFASRVAKSVHKLKLERVELLAGIGVHIMFLMALVNVIHFSCTSGEDHDFLMQNKLIRNSTMLLFLEAVVAFPGALNMKWFNVFCVANGVRLAVMLLSAPDIASLVLFTPVLTTMIFSHSLLVDFASATLVNWALCLISIYAFNALGQDSSNIQGHHAFDSDAVRLHYNHTQVNVVLFATMIGFYIKRSTIREVRDMLEKHETMKAKELTVESLLAVLCDAVVSLDAHLNLCGSSEKLRALR